MEDGEKWGRGGQGRDLKPGGLGQPSAAVFAQLSAST